MLWTVTAILFVLWVLGFVSGAKLGLWVHILLLLALASFILALAGRARSTV